jgi:uncharacterized RDD family membrane protein YckC
MIAFRFVNNFALAFFGPLFYLIPLAIYGILKIKTKNKPIAEGYASFERRGIAFMIDLLLIEGLAIGLQLIFPKTPDQPVFMAGIIVMVFAFSNMVILPSKTGWSLGKKVLGIKIIKHQNKEAGLFDIWYREIIKSWFSLSIFFLGCFWMLIGKKHLTWHDSIADTLVVRMNKNQAKKANAADAESSAAY